MTLSPEIREIAKTVLTDRQREVLRLHAAGWSNRRIARALDLAPSTVVGHRTRAVQILTREVERRGLASGAPDGDAA